MSIDWTVKWPTEPEEPVPTAKVIGEVLRDFLGGFAKHIQEKSRGFWLATLKGSKSHMFKRHGGKQSVDSELTDRWFEVWAYTDSVVVITRFQDEATNCLAAEFAKLCAQRWNGKLEEPT